MRGLDDEQIRAAAETSPVATYRDEVPMSFAEIEKVLGFALPPSSRGIAAWWSNNPAQQRRSRMRVARPPAYQTEQVDMRAVQGRLSAHRFDGREPASAPKSGHRHATAARMHEGHRHLRGRLRPGVAGRPGWGKARRRTVDA